MSQTQRSRATGVVAIVLGVLLAALMVYPWPQHTPTPIIGGVIPAPFFFWIIWTALFVGYVAWIVYRWDPYAAVARRAERLAAQSQAGQSNEQAQNDANGEER